MNVENYDKNTYNSFMSWYSIKIVEHCGDDGGNDCVDWFNGNRFIFDVVFVVDCGCVISMIEN